MDWQNGCRGSPDHSSTSNATAARTVAAWPSTAYRRKPASGACVRAAWPPEPADDKRSSCGTLTAATVTVDDVRWQICQPAYDVAIGKVGDPTLTQRARLADFARTLGLPYSKVRGFARMWRVLGGRGRRTRYLAGR